jgi:hypothetical protein
MGEQLKQQPLYNATELNSKNLYWVDIYESGPEGALGNYKTRRITQEQFIQLILFLASDNLEVNSNKVSVINHGNSTSDIQYVSVKAIVDYLSNHYTESGNTTQAGEFITVALEMLHNELSSTDYIGVSDTSDLGILKKIKLETLKTWLQTYFELANNKATNFTTKNNTLYPTTLAVYNEIVAQITSLVNSSPATLDTLAELATALGNDPNFATTITTALGLRELSSNKDNDVTLSSNSEIKYPTVKAVKTFVENTASNVNASSFIPPVRGNEIFRGLTYRINSASYDTYASLGISNSASISALTLNSNVFGKKFIRALYYASIVQTGRYTGVRGTSELFFIGSGFRFEVMFRVADTVFSSGCQMFFGLGAGTVDLPFGGTSLIQLDTMLNIIGIGCNSTDSNLNIYTNDNQGNCTKVDLGIKFPANRTSTSEMTTMYAAQIYNAIGSNQVKIEVKNLETLDVFQYTITNDLPATSQGLNIYACRTMNSPTTNTGQFELAKWGCSSI